MLWRDSLVEALARVFAGRNPADGVEHALSVEEAVRELLEEPEYRGSCGGDDEVLIAGALLHDVGFAGWQPQWCPDCVEHLHNGVRIGREILAQSQAFEGESNRLENVLSLIAHHDDTTYAFPSKTRGGAPAAAGHHDACSGTPPELTLLREADAIVHTYEDQMARSIKVWQGQGVPWFAGHGPQLASWMWHECVAANLRLCAKRAVLDASTDAGHQRALLAYDRIEAAIKQECDRSGVRYEPEVCPPAMRRSSVQRMGDRSLRLDIVAFHGWDSLDREMRSCTLRGDRSIRPYAAAKLRPDIVQIGTLTPMATYVLEERLEDVLELHHALMVQYCFGLWDLPAWMEFRYGPSEIQRISPPIVEEYVEEMRFPTAKRVAALVDGLHRCIAAWRSGAQDIRVLVASDVPYPLVPLPTTWPEVQLVRKRWYRYNAPGELPDVSQYSDIEITQDNFRYFFYRDLSPIGSRGERTFREFEELRADQGPDLARVVQEAVEH